MRRCRAGFCLNFANLIMRSSASSLARVRKASSTGYNAKYITCQRKAFCTIKLMRPNSEKKFGPAFCRSIVYWRRRYRYFMFAAYATQPTHLPQHANAVNQPKSCHTCSRTLAEANRHFKKETPLMRNARQNAAIWGGKVQLWVRPAGSGKLKSQQAKCIMKYQAS